jgi:hypothetical protein
MADANLKNLGTGVSTVRYGMYGFLGREFTNYAVIYGVQIYGSGP